MPRHAFLPPHAVEDAARALLSVPPEDTVGMIAYETTTGTESH